MTGILAVWNDRVSGAEDDYERWYLNEHLPERVGVPGFRFGRRYEALEADRRYFTFYEVEDPSVLASPAYLARLNEPTDWTRNSMASFRRMIRTVCDLSCSAGQARGAIAVTLRLPEVVPVGPDARAAVNDLASLDGVARAAIWNLAARQTPADTREARYRDTKDEVVPAVMVAECLRPRDATPVAARLREAAVRLGASAGGTIGIYAFLCSLDRGAL